MGFEGGAAIRRGPGGATRQNKPSLLKAFVALKHRNYRILWFSQVFSFMGMQMQQVARGLLAYQLTGSYTMVGVTMMAWGIPQLVFSLIGGAVADRVNKRNVILVSQTGTGALSLLNAILITTGQISIPWLFGLGLAQGTLFAFNMPARQALVAELVPQNALMNAIALNNVGMNATRIVGPALAGVMIGVWGVESAYYTQAFMLLFVVGLTLLLPPSTGHLAGAKNRGGIFAEIGLGLKFIGSSRTMLLLMLMAFVPTLLGMPYISLLPGFAVAELGLHPSAYGFMFTVTGIGAIVGSIGIAALTEFSRKPLLQAIVGLGFGLSLAALGLGSIFFGYSGALVALLAVGLFSTTYQTLNNTMIMSETRPEYYGRVMSVYMLTFSLFPLMSGPMGVVADLITAKTTFIFLGVGITAFIVLITMMNARYTFKRTVHVEADSAGYPSGSAAAAPTPPGRGGMPAPALPSFGPATVRSAVVAGDAGGQPLRAAARLHRPRRDYMSGEEVAATAPDYMRGGASAAHVTADAATSAPLSYLGTSVYGLTGRQVVASRAPRPQTYGLDGAGGPRPVGRTHRAIEAGDAVAQGAVAFVLDPTFVEASREPVGRFHPAPTEHIEATPPRLYAPRASRAQSSNSILVAALTASVTTSLLAMFLRPQR